QDIRKINRTKILKRFVGCQKTLCHFTTRTFATRKIVAQHVVADVADRWIATHYFVAQILVANLFSISGGSVWVFLLITCI
ncbi:MAG TPA: hypothetical protein PK509_10420, partial [Catalimonadaceae bacterium]|nr:hypothetical protein [Catalimonadaceae bacterium]